MKFIDAFFSDSLFASKPATIRVCLFLTMLMPLALALPVLGTLAGDYVVHAGGMELVAQAIREGIYLPNLANSVQLIGDPVISLSGRLYYLVGGYLSLLFGTPHIAIRLMLAATVFVSTVSVFRSTLRYSRSIALSMTITAMSSWATYAMNNFYVRGAIAEYFATMFLTASVGFLLLWWHPATKRRLSPALGMVICYSFAALTHPITAVYGALAICVVAFSLASLFGWRSIRWGEGSILVALVAILLSPWILLLLLFPPAQSAIAYSFLLYRYPGLDDALLRLLPLPISMMPPEYGYRVFVTQMNTPLLICALWLVGRLSLVKENRRIGAISFGMLLVAAIFFGVSVSPVVDAWLPTPLLAAQFGYRLVTYINLFVLVATIIATTGPGAFANTMPDRAVIASMLFLSFAGIVWNIAQMSHGMGYSHHQFLKIFPSASEAYSFHFSNGCQYSMGGPVDDVPACNTRSVNLFIPPQMHAGTPVQVAPGAYVTNVVFFPWNELLLDNVKLQTRPVKWYTAVTIDKPGELTYKSEIPLLYIWLDRFVLWLFLLLCLAWCREVGSSWSLRSNLTWRDC